MSGRISQLVSRPQVPQTTSKRVEPQSTSRPQPKPQPRPTARREDSSFEVATRKGVPLTPALTETQRQQALSGIRRDFQALVTKIGTTQPPMSEEQVKQQAEGLRSRMTAIWTPADGDARDHAYHICLQMGRARQYIQNGELERAQAVLDVDSTDPTYPDQNAKYHGVQAYRNFLNATGVMKGTDPELKEVDAQLASLRTQIGFKPPATLEEQCADSLKQADALTAYYKSKDGVLSGGKFTQTAVEYVIKYGNELKQALALKNDPTRDMKVRAAKSSLDDYLKHKPASEKDFVKYVDDKREWTLNGLQRLGEAASVLGPWGKAASFAFKTIETGLRYAGNDIGYQEALAKTVGNGIEALVGDRIAKAGGALARPIQAAVFKTVTAATADAAGVMNNPKLTFNQKLDEMQRVLRGAVLDGVREGLVTAISQYVGGKASSAEIEEFAEQAVSIAKSCGMEQALKTPLDDLKNLTKRNPTP